MIRRKWHIILTQLFVLINLASSFDPCDNFDLRQCDPAAECFSGKDLKPECRCPGGTVDLSPDPSKPGHKCQKVPVATRKDGSCSVTDPLSCDAQKSEVCLFIDGKYRCDCPKDYSRLADGRCLFIDECKFLKLNDCPVSTSECIDKDVGYECRCKNGLIDLNPLKPGRKCGTKVQECDEPEKYKVDCSENSVCVETDASYECRCLPGFTDLSTKYSLLPGRKCVEILDECQDSTLNDCSAYALCTDEQDGYSCHCNDGFIDASPNNKAYPGRVCNKPSNVSRPPETFPQMDDLCDPNSARACRPNEVCVDSKSDRNFRCECSPMAFRFRDGSCRLKAACETNNECDSNAICTSLFDTVSCKCREGFFDNSIDPENKPGRRCKKLENECASNTHNCHLNAHCEDRLDGFSCTCNKGFADTSSNYGLDPGRLFCFTSLATNECAEKRLNTCDENADCLDEADGYKCACYPGFVDVSSSANLPPGRVCTIATSCTRQKTDLMFLVDGSGSIGADVFGNEILRFISEFVDLFNIEQEQTRVGLIQYSDQVRHEFDFNQYNDKQQLKSAILQTEYLTGLTRTGAAIKHMANEGFSERRGARPLHSKNVSRVAIIITDGRSQDNVTIAAHDAQTFSNINLFAIGVSDHVLTTELEAIAGSPERWFFVDRFKDLDTRLRSLIQKIACPTKLQTPGTKCEIGTQRGCNRALNEICVLSNGQPRCVCPPLFDRHPLTGACGDPDCNPDLPTTSCPKLEICARTPFGRYRCVCQQGFKRDSKTGVCISKSLSQSSYNCSTGMELNPRTGQCIIAGSCDPQDKEACEMRLNEKCLPHPNGQYHVCRCEGFQRRHPLTNICLSNECQNGQNECDKNALCIDTQESYICACPQNYIDRSPDPNTKPGRICSLPQDECLTHQNDCSPFADCIDTHDGYECRCKKGYTDFSKNQRRETGRICHLQLDECAQKDLNDCNSNATCTDTTDGFFCTCNSGFADIDELRHPGRNCIKGNVNECRSPMLNRCSNNAVCIDEPNGYRCECKNNYIDNSPAGSFGFVCELPKHPCEEIDSNDCSKEGGLCEPNGPLFNCKCLPNFIDRSPDQNKPGRVCVMEQPVCEDPNRNDCHPEAQCIPGNGTQYTCKCRDGFLDKSPTPSRTGRLCIEQVNECLDRRFHDCDKIALCEDLPEGFQCRCPEESLDLSPDKINRPGRICKPTVNECSNIRLNTCSRFAECVDEVEGYTCRCKKGYFDDSPKSLEPGRVCAVFNEDFKVTSAPLTSVDEVQCGKDICFMSLNEVCVEGSHCECRPGEARSISNGKCGKVQKTPLSIRIVSNGDHPLRYSSQYNNPKNVPYVEFSNDFRNEMATLFNSTVYALKYVSSEVTAITHPKTVNNTWSEGLLINFTVATKQSEALVDKCDLWSSFFEQAIESGSQIGQLKIASDSFLLNPCPLPPNYCAGIFCNSNLGEVCIRGKCAVNYCEDVKFCPSNTTCINMADRADCQCNLGFVDIRESKERKLIGLASDVLCLRAQDVDECALGLHNCSAIAQCTNRRIGYECSCPPGYVDGNPSDPGKICAGLLCDRCNGHGDCIPDSITGNIKCSCAEGFSGDYCEHAGSDLPYILLILLALLFLFITLCCLIYFCSKCRCFKRVSPWATLNQTHSTGFSENNSDLYALAIPRVKLVQPIMADNLSMGSGDSDFTVREDAERRVITEITRTEFHDGANGADRGGTFDAYHTIEEFDVNGQPHRQTVHHQGYLAYPDYGQDDRSIESYHTNEHRLTGPNGVTEYRSESLNRHS